MNGTSTGSRSQADSINSKESRPAANSKSTSNSANNHSSFPFEDSSKKQTRGSVLPLFVPAWIRPHLPQLKGGPLSVLVCYASHADRNGIAFPSLMTLRRETGYGHGSVKRARKLLARVGLLKPLRQARSSSGQWGRKCYIMGWSCAQTNSADRGSRCHPLDYGRTDGAQAH